MKIAIATFADLPNPPVKGGAVEALLDDICLINENKYGLDIDFFSLQDSRALIKAKEYKHTNFIYYQRVPETRLSKKTIVHKVFGKSIPSKTMLKIVNLINENKYDFVIITSINYEMEYIFKEIKSKVIWYLHGDPLSVLSSEAIRRIITNCQAVITVSDFVGNRVKSIDVACPVITVRNCTDLIPLSNEEGEKEREKIRKQINIGENERLFAYIGRITPIKGIYELQQAFYKAQIENSKLLIVGAPSNAQEEQYYDRLKSNADHRIIFWGYEEHKNLNKLYSASDCIVATSICQEAALLIALEAAMCRRPLIATKIGGIPEYSDNNTLLVEYNDNFVENIAEAMRGVFVKKFNFKDNVKSNGMEYYYNEFCLALEQISGGK